LNKSKSSISLFAFVIVLFTVGFIPYLTQDAFAQEQSEEPDLADGIEVETDEVETTITQASISNLGQEVSNFVHESRKMFELQKVETKYVIAQCRVDANNAEPSDRQSAREQCKSNLKDIKESYKSLRETYRETFKQFRDDMRILIKESRGLQINEGEKSAALANIDSLSKNEDKREKIKELQQKMREETKAEKKQLREQMKKDREITRVTMKDQREADRVDKKDQREADRVDKKDQREADRVDKKDQRVTDRVDKKDQREARDATEASEEP